MRLPGCRKENIPHAGENVNGWEIRKDSVMSLGAGVGLYFMQQIGGNWAQSPLLTEERIEELWGRYVRRYGK